VTQERSSRREAGKEFADCFCEGREKCVGLEAPSSNESPGGVMPQLLPALAAVVLMLSYRTHSTYVVCLTTIPPKVPSTCYAALIIRTEETAHA
jgi:hypothetical protein